MEFLIDDRGTVWPGLSHRFTYGEDRRTTIDYALSELGFIHIRTLNSAMRIRFNPLRIRRVAMIAAFYLMTEGHPRRVMLSYGREAGNDEIHGRVDHAICRIEELVTTQPPSDLVVSSARRRSLDRLPKGFERQYALLVQAANAGPWSAERLEALRAAGLLENAIVVRKPRASARLIIDHWGTNRPYVSPLWVQIARGKEVEDHPLIQLGSKIVTEYREILSDRQPRVHDVDFFVARANGSELHHRYGRILLPLGASGTDEYAVNWMFSQD